MAALTTPPGFFAANDCLNQLPGHAVRSIIRGALADSCTSMTVGTAFGISQAEFDSAIHCIQHIARSVKKTKAAAGQLGAFLDKNTDFNANVRDIFAKEFEGWCVKEGSSVLQLGRLVSLEWKLGVSVASSSNATAEVPFVALQLKIAESSGKLETHHLELNLQEFQDFAANFYKISQRLDFV